MPEVLANQPLAGTLASGMTSGDTSLTLTTGQGAGRGYPATGTYRVAVYDPATGNNFEVMTISSRSGDVLTIAARGQEGTTAVAHSAGDVVDLILTAGALQAAFVPTTGGAFTGPVSGAGIGTYTEPSQRILKNAVLTDGGTFTIVSTTAYFVYLGLTTQAITPKYVEVYITTIGTNTSVEYGLFSSPTAPAKAAQTLTKLATAVGATTLTVNAANRNTSAMATVIPAGTHLWAGFRTTSSVAPVAAGTNLDWGEGNILTLAAAGTFAATSTFAGAIPSQATTLAGPTLRATLD